MTPEVSIQKPVRKPASRLTRGAKLFKTIISAIQDKKGEEIISLDLHSIPEAVADFFIICTAGSGPQIRAIADEVERQAEEATGEMAYHKEGHQGLQWVIIDFVDVVVHIMHPEARRHYKLEEMWSDAPQVGHS